VNFKQEYFHYFEHDDKYDKAQLLWLWYDYYTEMYDRTLWSQRPSPYDETMVILDSHEARSLSNRNAGELRKKIAEIARYYEIDNDTLNRAKSDSFRNRPKMNKRIEEYLQYDKLGKLNFINGIN